MFHRSSIDIISSFFPGLACWDQIWATTPGWQTLGPLQTSLTTAKTRSTAALANWIQRDITTVRALWCEMLECWIKDCHCYCNIVICCAAVGIINYPNQSEKHSAASNDSPIYSTINTTAEDDLLAYYDTYSSTSYNQGPDPYSSNPILSNSGFGGLEQDLDHWTIKSGHSGSEYAKLQYTKKSNGENFVEAEKIKKCNFGQLNWKCGCLSGSLYAVMWKVDFL